MEKVKEKRGWVESDAANVGEMDPDCIEHLHREKRGELPWE